MEYRPYNLSLIQEYGLEVGVVYGHLWLQCLAFGGEYETQICYIRDATGLSRGETMKALEFLVGERLITHDRLSTQMHKFTICDMDKYPLWEKKKQVTYSY